MESDYMNDKELIQFVEWLPNNSELFADLDTEVVIAQINNLASSEDGKQTLEQLTNQYKNKEMGLFKKGGKLDYLLCLKKGGKGPDCGCNKKQEGGVVTGNWDNYHTIINAPGDTLRFKQYFSGPAYMQTHPEGGVTYERSTRDGVTRMYGDGYQPTWWERNVLGYQPVTEEEKSNWEQLIKNHTNDPAIKDKTKSRSVLEILGIKKNQMGGVLFAKEGDQLGYSKAANYYARHSDSATIKKIQEFLIGKGYYGDFNEALGVENDGKFGRKTYEAIRAYQRDQGLKDDGMWGEDTNSMARLLNATNSPYRNDESGTSGAHSGWIGSGNYSNPNIPKFKSKGALMSAIGDVEARAISDPEWFWGDSEDAAGWRQFLQQNWKNPEEAAGMKSILDNIYSNTPREIKNRIDNKKLPQYIQQARMNTGITDATGKFTQTAVTKVLPAITLPLSVAAGPVSAGVGLLGGLAGGSIGGLVNRYLHEGEHANEIRTDELGTPAIVVRDPDQVYGAQGAVVGSAIGSLAGAYGASKSNFGDWGYKPAYKPSYRHLRVGDMADAANHFHGSDGRFISPGNRGQFTGIRHNTGTSEIWGFKKGGTLK